MKISPFFPATLALGVLLTWPLPRALAINVSEGADFPDAAGSAVPYPLDVGENIFNGTVSSFSLDFAEHFKVSVPAGQQIYLASKTWIDGTTTGRVTFNGEARTNPPLNANFVTGYPLPVGVYAGSAELLSATGLGSWSVHIFVQPLPDYTVSTTGGAIVVTDAKGNGDTLAISEPAAGQIRFAAGTRTFSVNGGASIAGHSGDLPLAGISAITVNAAAGQDTINVGGFSGTTFPALTIHGGTGDDTVNFTGDITFASGKSLDVDLQNDDASPGVDTVNLAAGANLFASGTVPFTFVAITIRCSGSVSLAVGASLEVGFGTIIIEANQQPTPTAGNFIGVDLSGGSLKGFALSSITVTGRGGNAAGGVQVGVLISGGGVIDGEAVTVTGTGGAGGGQINRGVTVIDAGSRISGSDNVTVTGIGGGNGAAGNDYNLGVSVLAGGVIAGVGSVNLDVLGTGGSGGFFNQGIEVAGADSAITATAGGVSLRGVAGAGTSVGVYLSNDGTVSNSAGGGTVKVDADSVAIDGTATILTASPDSAVTFRPLSLTTNFDLGGSDAAGSPATLGLTDAELDRVTTGTLIFRHPGTGNLQMTQPLTRATATNVIFSLDSGVVLAGVSGTDVSLGGGTLTLEARLSSLIAGTTADSQYVQLKVAGGVSLAGQPLVLAPFGFTGAAGNTFTLIDNDGTDVIAGTFQGVPEGGSLLWPGTPTLNARVTYQGGSGNDVVVTLVSALTVTNLADTGVGSLRKVLEYAAMKPGADTVTFDPALSGGTIRLASAILVSDAGGVTIDASALPSGLTIDGDTDGNGTADTQLFTIASGSASMTGLSLRHGAGISVGAISNLATLTLTRCALSDNSAGISGSGGAIFNSGNLTLTHCTLSRNNAGAGGAIFHSSGTLTLTHCTVSGNDSGGSSGAISGSAGMTLSYTIVAGNTPGNISGAFNSTNNLTSGNPLLAPLGDYGGPTQTMALRPGSPARDGAVGSPATSDQRGFPIVGPRDIGAYEAGTIRNYAAWAYETLPATATVAQLAAGFDFDLDGRLNVLEYATLTDGATATDDALLVLTPNAAGTEATITFPVRLGALDLIYELERSLPGVGPWVKIAQVDTLQGTFTANYIPGIFHLGNTATDSFYLDTTLTFQSKAFYRLKVRGL